MDITKKMLIVFLLTILFVKSSVHCSDSTLGVGIKQNWKKCFSPAPCQKAGTQGCMEFCRNISFLLFGECTTNSDQCCCVTKTK
ncbi:LOW QUALITY PROTEIN: defensin-like protein 115 [Arabidopsis lyrata subsp. lyrata]|uniref:LOW QUALITY PROTEIN: defensin-like protein 115 n=1 Tax=Arabidopsis lyrata subsp. lyrata TaxID=81972 RepID=UPI000A29D5F8|nr:LOW QUALITY PROTEIN: defensin-like protein 115 [Arabidopsis lyrata subsp. lyrata]|eukprot:XP_002888467.2 LOW QUALITY PROTEIN: defensin-like protein 115 [Arabidopsis lyrata subsp. lyrata]